MKENKRHALSRDDYRSKAHSGGSALPFLSGMGLGAGIMYVLDPDRGNRRRGMAQQRFVRLVHVSSDALDKALRDLQNRVEGLVCEATHLFRREQVPDDVIEQRIRARLGRVACHPGAIEVYASGGHVVLRGPVLRGEADEITRAMRRVRGVSGVECHLEEHDASENIPGLQGEAHRTGARPELLQNNWAPGTRLVFGGIGLALAGRAIRHPGLVNGIAGALGVALLARSGRGTRVMGEVMESVTPSPGPRAGSRQSRRQGSPSSRVEEGVRTAGLGRKDAVGKSGVYPATGPLPPGPGDVRMAGSFGQGERGAAGYQDHGTSEMTYTGGQVLGALSGTKGGSSVDLASLLKPREVPRDQWMTFFNQLDKGLDWPPVTVEVREGGQTRVEQRGVPLDGLGADVKDRDSFVTVSVGRNADKLVVHTILAKRVAVRDEGENKLLEIEANDGTTTIVRFRSSDLKPERVVA